jgi:transcriptional regulator of aromatic amino acid metabolism
MNLPGLPLPTSPPRRGMLNQLRVNPVATHQESVEEQAALTLDLYGHVLNGTQAAAQLLGMRLESLAGHTASALISPLPLGRTTPGYNLAYATFHAFGKVWQRRTSHSADHGQFEEEVAMAMMTWRGARAIRLTLRPLGQQAHRH